MKKCRVRNIPLLAYLALKGFEYTFEQMSANSFVATVKGDEEVLPVIEKFFKGDHVAAVLYANSIRTVRSALREAREKTNSWSAEDGKPSV